MREDGCDCEAAGALDVHEERPRGGHEGLCDRFAVSFCGGLESSARNMYLELVLSGLGLRSWVEEIDCENLN